MRRRHLESVSAALYGRCLGIVRIQPQLSGKGVLGHSPKCVLVPFTQVKVTPRRRGVQIMPLQKAPRRRRRLQTSPRRAGVQMNTFYKTSQCQRRPQISQTKYINPQFVKIPYACACARACAAACALGRARGSPSKIVPKGTRKNGAVPPGSAGQKQENKNFSKKFAQTGRNLPPRLRIILVEGLVTRKSPPFPPKNAFCTKMTHQGETI